MKGKRIIAGGVIFIILFVANVSVALYFYKQYNDNINSINQENWLTKIKLENVEKNSDIFKASLEALSSQFKNYDKSITNLDRRIDSTETNSKELLSQMQSIKLDIEDWQKRYGSAISQLSELRERTEVLMASLEQIKKGSTGNVDLGQISVEGSRSNAVSAQKSGTNAAADTARRTGR